MQHPILSPEDMERCALILESFETLMPLRIQDWLEKNNSLIETDVGFRMKNPEQHFVWMSTVMMMTQALFSYTSELKMSKERELEWTRCFYNQMMDHTESHHLMVVPRN